MREAEKEEAKETKRERRESEEERRNEALIRFVTLTR